ncbi:MAG: MBL fold metallo-hydrolase, partial [Methylomonas sp.]
VCLLRGAHQDRFMAWDQAENTYHVVTFEVNEVVSQLIAVPKLGYEHAAYRIKTEAGVVWLDAPSAFNRNLPAVETILFTHRHFLGASNLYRRLWNCENWLHELDARHRLSQPFDFDRRFSDDFTAYGIEAYHIGGHTEGFTCYIHRDVLFIGDYVFLTDAGMIFNPYGPEQETRKQARRIHEIVNARALKLVCGYNYVAHFADWLPGLERLVLNP